MLGKSTILISSLCLFAPLSLCPFLSCSTGETDPCTEEEVPCTEEEVPPLTSDIEGKVQRLARIVFTDTLEFDAAGELDRYAMITASFVDLSDYTSTPAPTIDFSPTCFGVAGLPTTEGEPVPLEISSVTVSGGPAGSITLTRLGEGRYASPLLDELFAGAELTLEVVGVEGANGFPGFTNALPVPAHPELFSPDPTRSWSLGSSGDLQIEWVLRDSTFISLEIEASVSGGEVPQAGTARPRLRCLAVEDGCHRVPRAALDWLRAGGGEEFKMELKRHRFTLLELQDDAIASIDLIAGVDMLGVAP